MSGRLRDLQYELRRKDEKIFELESELIASKSRESHRCEPISLLHWSNICVHQEARKKMRMLMYTNQLIRNIKRDLL